MNTSTVIHETPGRFGDAKPLGIFSFALTTTVLSLINIQARNVTVPNIIIGLGIIRILQKLMYIRISIRWLCSIYRWNVGTRNWRYIYCAGV